jgi:hypothetical protein
MVPVIVVAFLGVALSAEPAQKDFRPGQEGWLTLFDGSALERWSSAKGSDWAIKDGVLTGTRGEIWSYWQWTDFELVAVCRGSGAILCRASSAPPAQAGYRLDVETGRFLGPQGKMVAEGSISASNAWREVRLVASKGRFGIGFNSKKVAEGQDATCLSMGKIGLAASGKMLQLKLLRIRPLNREVHAAVPSPNSACYVCHANFENEVISTTHAAKDIGCSKCHGPSLDHRSDEANVTAPDVMFVRGEIDATCLECHERHERKEPKEKKSIPKNPVCTDCHGNHRSSN